MSDVLLTVNTKLLFTLSYVHDVVSAGRAGCVSVPSCENLYHVLKIVSGDVIRVFAVLSSVSF